MKNRLRCPDLVLRAALLRRRPMPKPCPPRVASTAAIRTAAYNGEEVYKLRGFVGYQIDLQFEPGEVFAGLGAGDLEGLSFVGQDNHLFLKPKAAKVATNLTVLTNRRHYQFDYTAYRSAPQPTTRCHLCAAVHLCSRSRRSRPPRRRQGASILQLDARLGQACTEYRLLVLRQADAEAGRGLRRRRPHAPEIRREFRPARDFRAQ